MRYSLLSRFQGGLLGSLIGETLANGGEKPISVWSKIGAQATETLIRSGQIPLGTWQQILKSIEKNEAKASPVDLKQGTGPKTLIASSSEAALATLPLAIFFHESPSLLTENLQSAIVPGQNFAQGNDDLLIWGYAISLTLREKADPLIPQLLSLKVPPFRVVSCSNSCKDALCQRRASVRAAFPEAVGSTAGKAKTTLGASAEAAARLERGLRKVPLASAIAEAAPGTLNLDTADDAQSFEMNSNTAPLVQQLEQVQFFLEQGSGLEETVNYLTRYPQPSGCIALALYCFSSTPEDFRLCVRRALRSGYHPQLTGALTGALAGMYNGLAGIPPGWRCLHPILKQCDRQATRLFSAWSGVYEPNGKLPATAAVASPSTIQKRPSLKIISQEE